MDLVIPRYGSGALADVVPSLMGALGVPGFGSVLPVAPARAVCLLLIDGMGSQLLQAHARHAPFLAGLAAASESITAGFPASTTTSITSVGTGRPPGEHGIVGYSFMARGPGGPPGRQGVHHGQGHAELLEALTWRVDGQDARERFVPEEVQPWPTALERAAAAGVTVRLAVPAWHGGSGLTRAALRGGTIAGTFVMGDIAAAAASALATAGPVFCYAYHGGLDLAGHVYGPGSPAWCFELAQVDLLATQIAGALPRDGLLAVVADHGMVAASPGERVDIDHLPELTDGVLLMGGDSRARAVYPAPGAAQDVLATWRSVLDGRATVLSGRDAVAAGWFGPVVTDAALSRIADVLAVATGTTTLVRTAAEPRQSAMLGVHGGLSAAEQLIPFLTVRG
jgi:hypothetical protein